MKYVINANGIVFFHGGKPVKVEKSSALYAKVIKAFDLSEDEQDAALEQILAQASGQFEKDGFSIENDEVYYQGERLPTVLANKVRSIAQEGLPIKLFANFWENLQQNPSATSVRELYDFLAYKELPITEDGCFLAYKGVDAKGWSISGNTKTKVIKGKVDSGGRIFNGIGEEIEVRRMDVDDNRQHHCSFGLHVGSLEYAQDFAQGQVVIVKVNPKDVVSVPSDCHCQKCRVSAYKVVDSFTVEITASITDEDGDAYESEEQEERSELVNKIDNYLTKKFHDGVIQVDIQKIRNACSPDYPSKIAVLDALNELGYTWNYNSNGQECVIL
jgi:hypothetical protein